MVVDKGDQVAFVLLTARGDMRAMHDVALPHIIGQLSLKLAPVGWSSLLFDHQIVAVQEAVDSAEVQVCADGHQFSLVHEFDQFYNCQLRHLAA